MVIKIFIDQTELNVTTAEFLWKSFSGRLFTPKKFGYTEPPKNGYTQNYSDVAASFMDMKRGDFFMSSVKKGEFLYIRDMPEGVKIMILDFRIADIDLNFVLDYVRSLLDNKVPIFFAFASTDAEYNEKHTKKIVVNGREEIIKAGQSYWDYANSFTGLYVLNYFCKDISDELLHGFSAQSGYILEPLEKGGTLLYASEELRNRPEELSVKQQEIINELGTKYFFDKDKEMEFTHPPKFQELLHERSKVYKEKWGM